MARGPSIAMLAGLAWTLAGQPQPARAQGGDWLRVCGGSPVPYGWVIVNIDRNSFTCGSQPQYTIRRAEGQSFLEVCANSEIPCGWVVTNVDPYRFTCGGYATYTIQRVEDATCICYWTPHGRICR
jgi:hypothetical protein